MTFDKELLFKTFATKVVPIVVEDGTDRIELYAKELSAKAVFDMQKLQKKDAKGTVDNEAFTISLVAQALCDEDGKPVMTLEEAKELSKLRVRAFNKLAEVVAEAVGLSPPKAAPPKANGADDTVIVPDAASAAIVGNA